MNVKIQKDDNRIIHIGIGIILFLTISTISHLFVETIYAILLHLNAEPRIIIWSRLIVSIIVFTVGIIVGIDLIRYSKKPDRKIFTNLLGLMLIAVSLSILLVIFKDPLNTESSLTTLSKAREYGERNSIELSVVSMLSFLNYIIIGIIIYFKR